jgi:hypothetical protein
MDDCHLNSRMHRVRHVEGRWSVQKDEFLSWKRPDHSHYMMSALVEIMFTGFPQYMVLLFFLWDEGQDLSIIIHV